MSVVTAEIKIRFGHEIDGYRIRNITCLACVGIKKTYYFFSSLITTLITRNKDLDRKKLKPIENLDWLILCTVRHFQVLLQKY